MKTGKLPEIVLKRSFLKQIKTKRKEVLIGAGVGEDCAVLSFGDNSLIGAAAETLAWPDKSAVKYAVRGCVNNLAAAGAEPVAITVCALFPQSIEETDIKAMSAQIEEECAVLQIQAAGGYIEITGGVNRPILTLTGIGRIPEENSFSVKNIKPGQDVIMSKWIGLEGTAIIAELKEKELLSKFPARFVEEAKAFDSYLSIVPEAATAVKSGVCAMHHVKQGGIFGALWEMAEGADVGLVIDLKKIPIRQETVEVCEFFEINPYELVSGGSLLMTADKGYDIVKELEKNNIPAAVIGRTTDNNDRIVINEEERRFLEPPKSDELHKITTLLL